MLGSVISQKCSLTITFLLSLKWHTMNICEAETCGMFMRVCGSLVFVSVFVVYWLNL